MFDTRVVYRQFVHVAFKVFEGFFEGFEDAFRILHFFKGLKGIKIFLGIFFLSFVG